MTTTIQATMDMTTTIQATMDMTTTNQATTHTNHHTTHTHTNQGYHHIMAMDITKTLYMTMMTPTATEISQISP